MKTALLLLATGKQYEQYIQPLVDSAEKFFPPHDTLIWCDHTPDATKAGSRVFAINKEPLGYPNETLFRYRTFLSQEKRLRTYDYLYYCDVDMLFVAPISEEEIFSDGITATLHPGFAHQRTHPDGTTVYTYGSPERANKDSRAYIPWRTNNQYFCGGFNGGKASAYLEMARVLQENIDWDKEQWGRGYSAVWHDESYMNRYLYDNPPAKILTPSFCYPENYDGGYGWAPELYPPKLLALDKRSRGGR
jgi:hypothetical protein